MRSITLAVVVALSFGGSLFAVEKTLIDFNQYETKLAGDPVFAESSQQNNAGGGNQAAENQQQNEADGQTSAGLDFQVGVEDMSLDRWIVELNSSSRFGKSLQYSFTKKIQTKGIEGTPGARTVLGARIHFPSWRNNTYAEIKPAFEFPIFDKSGNKASLENGIIDNTGQLYSITAEVYGRNYKHGFYVRLADETGLKKNYFMGYLFFDGWRQLTWVNPNYVDNVDLREIKRLPLVPTQGFPYKRLEGFVITRDAREMGGDYLFYIANVKVAFDLAVLSTDEDIDEEANWHILSDLTKSKNKISNKINSELLNLRRRELTKMHVKRGEENQAGDGEAATTTENNTDNAAPAAQGATQPTA